MKMINPTVTQINTAAACRISCRYSLTGSEAAALRDTVNDCMANGCETIYLDTREVTSADLSGINEVIHTAAVLRGSNCRFILIYKAASVVEKWVQITGLSKFVTTALIPSV